MLVLHICNKSPKIFKNFGQNKKYSWLNDIFSEADFLCLLDKSLACVLVMSGIFVKFANNF